MADGEIYYLSEEEHEREVKDYIYSNLSELTQKKAMTAIKELLVNGKDWQWIHYALNKKSAKQWEKFGFGLLFNWNFEGSVYEAIKRDEELDETSYDDVENWLLEDEIERKKDEYESKLGIDIGASFEYNRSDAQKPTNINWTHDGNNLLDYEPIEIACKKSDLEGIKNDLEWLELHYPEQNKEYVEYERKRLGII